MEISMICLALALVGGLMLSRLTKLMHLPAVTAYLVAGLILGPFCLGALKIPGLGFNSLSQVEGLQVVTQTALGFIAFTIGNEFRLGQLKTMGKAAIVIGILQAVFTTVLVDLILIGLHCLRPEIISIPCALTLGAIASATAPAATLMVVRQYKADGPLTRLLMLVVAIDDAVGLLLFSVSFGIATALAHGQVSILAVAVEPIVEVVLSLGLGAVMGWLLHYTEQFFHSRSKRMSLSVGFVLLTVGLSTLHFEVGPIHCGFSLLLVCMMTGTVFCNICPTSEELMERIEGWTMPLNILFFVLSGAELDLTVFGDLAVVGIGINCNQTKADFPPELASMAASVSMVTHREVSPAALAAAIMEALSSMSSHLLTDKAAIMDRYRSGCITLGQEVSLHRAGCVTHARAVGIDNEGALLVCHPDGRTEAVNSGEASVRGMYGYV